MNKNISMETKVDTPIQITDTAANEFKRLMEEKNVPADHGLRVGVKGGGCAGFSYILGFDVAKPEDEQFEINGLTVFVNKGQLLYLHGVELDYKTGLDARGFAFSNPNASDTCGCGSSFAS